MNMCSLGSGALLTLLIFINPTSGISGDVTPAVKIEFIKTVDKSVQAESVRGLINRRFPAVKDQLIVEIIPGENGKEVFEVVNGDNGKVILRGSTGVAIAQGLNWYMKHVCNQMLTWCGSTVNITPATMKKVPGDKFRQVLTHKYIPYMNYCTLSYSAPWWNWERWEWEIDFMALNGINMPLAMTGLEGAWYNALIRPEIGFTDSEARQFLVSPAHMAWQWMQNVENISEPLPMSWIKSHIELGQKIIKRERDFGMAPIQQGFSGHVPLKFKTKFPDAKIRQQPSWGNFPGVGQLDPTDPLFAKFGKIFIEEEGKLFGLGGLYAADPFHESKPPEEIKPENMKTYLIQVGNTIYNTMKSADPNAVWIKQSWSLRKDMFDEIPKGKLIFLDLDSGKWNSTKSFWGHLFCGGQLHNFGGRINLHGDIRALNKNPAQRAPLMYPDSALGTGLFMEGIVHNPVFYEAVMDMWWRDSAIATPEWIKGYVQRRYGCSSDSVMKAWEYLLEGPYRQGTTGLEFSSIICARPAINCKKSGPNSGMKIPYKPEVLVSALESLLSAGGECQNSDGYQFDVMDITRQVLANLAQWQHQKVRAAFEAADPEAFRENAQIFRDILMDADRICETRAEYRLSEWIQDAGGWATTPEEKKYFEKYASMLLTYWGPDKNPRYYDYAWREWGGLIRDFYLPRWEMFHNYILESFDKNQEYNEKDLPLLHGREAWRANEFYETLADWEEEWVDKPRDMKRPEKIENTIEVAKEILKKWNPTLKEAYQK